MASIHLLPWLASRLSINEESLYRLRCVSPSCSTIFKTIHAMISAAFSYSIFRMKIA
jgi:hypothetical protein